MDRSCRILPFQENDDEICCVCLDPKKIVVDNPRSTCDHKRILCEKCVNEMVRRNNRGCPLCREPWGENTNTSADVIINMVDLQGSPEAHSFLERFNLFFVTSNGSIIGYHQMNPSRLTNVRERCGGCCWCVFWVVVVNVIAAFLIFMAKLYNKA